MSQKLRLQLLGLPKDVPKLYLKLKNSGERWLRAALITKFSKILLPAVVLIFLVQNKSFTAIGIPGSRPSKFCFLSKFFESLIVWSKQVVIKLLSFFPFLILFLPFSLVVIQPDLGTALSIVFLGLIILFACGIKIWKFVLGGFAIIFSIPVLLNYLKPYQKDRLISFLNPEEDALGRGYQLIQSKIALGSGGFSGKGFLEGTQSYLQYLPEKQTDFIFTLIGEEFGFLGTIFIIFLFLLVISICYYISIKSIHIFGRILSIGVGANIFRILVPILHG